MAAKNVIQADSIKPIRDKVFITDLEGGMQKTFGGIIIPDDDMKDRGIRERWGRVHAVGPMVKDLKVGEWVLIQHGRWTNGIDVIRSDGSKARMWAIDYPDAVLLVTDNDPRRPSLVYDGSERVSGGGRGA